MGKNPKKAADSLDSLFEGMRKLSALAIASDNVDDSLLLKQDKMLKTWFMYKKQKESDWNCQEEPNVVLEEYREKTLIRRTHVLSLANDYRFQAECMCETDKLESAYLELLEDMKKYTFAWFGIIFAEREHITYAYFAVRVLLSLVRLQLKNGEFSKSAKTLKICKRAAETFSSFSASVAEDMWNTPEREEWREHATTSMKTTYDCLMLEWIYYGICGEKVKATEVFVEACFEEMTWFDTDVEDDGFGVSCKSIISSVIGKRIDDMMDVVLQADNDFLSKCVTFGLRKVTSFGLLPRPSEANLGKICFHCGTSEEDVGRKIMSCSRCKSIYYCSRQCQKDDWKRHKKECKDGFRIA